MAANTMGPAKAVAVLARLKSALPNLGVNGWHEGVAAIDVAIAALPVHQAGLARPMAGTTLNTLALVHKALSNLRRYWLSNREITLQRCVDDIGMTLNAIPLGADPRGQSTLPDYLFDGCSVYERLTPDAKRFVSPEAVSAVLDACCRVEREHVAPKREAPQSLNEPPRNPRQLPDEWALAVLDAEIEGLEEGEPAIPAEARKAYRLGIERFREARNYIAGRLAEAPPAQPEGMGIEALCVRCGASYRLMEPHTCAEDKPR